MRFVVASSLALALVLASFFSPISAQEAYRTGISILNLQDFDLDAGQFEADFILRIRTSNNTEIAKDLTAITFQNGRRINRYESTPMGLRIYSYFLFRPNNNLFPFDRNTFQIIFQLNKPLTENYTLQWDPSLSEHNTELMYFGWNFDLSQSSAKVRLFDLATNISTQQLVWTIVVTRNVAYGIKILLPPSVIFLLVLASFTIPPNEGGANLMLFDSYMIVIYAITLSSVAATIIILRLSTDKRHSAKNIAHLVQYYVASFVWLIAPMIFLFLFIQWWLALLLLPLPSIVLAAWLAIWRKVIRPRFLQVKTGERAKEEGEEDLKDEMLDDYAYDPDVRTEMLKKEATTTDVKHPKASSKPLLTESIKVESPKRDPEPKKMTHKDSDPDLGNAKESEEKTTKESPGVKRRKSVKPKPKPESSEEENALPDD